MAKCGKEYIKANFLITRLIENYVDLLIEVVL